MSFATIPHINYQQNKRLKKADRERFYLIDKKYEKIGNNFNWLISGSTYNIYHVNFNSRTKLISCNCPDSKTWSKKQDCMCKHCCYVVTKVLDKCINLHTSNIFKDKIFSSEEANIISDNFISEKINFNPIDHEYDVVLSQYRKNLIEDAKPCQFKSVCEKNDECPICYENFSSDCDRVTCPDCKNTFHKNCMEQWLRSGNQQCPYCRSDKWKSYFKRSHSYDNVFVR